MKEIDMSLELVGHTVTFKAYTPNQVSPHGAMLGIKSTWAEDLIAASEKSFEPNKTQTKPKSKNPKYRHSHLF